MPATLKDIAKRLNLSVSTVSYALNDGPKPVSEEVRHQVLRVADELGYRPNRIARSLVTRRSRTLGVALPRIERDSLLRSFVQLALNAVVNAAEDEHYDVLLLTARERNRPEGLNDMIQDSRVDGVLLIAPPEIPETFRLLRESGVPHAVISSGAAGEGPYFRGDDAGGVRLALRHLWDLGHRRIAHFAGRLDLFDGRLRRDTYLAFMAEHGQSVPEGYVVVANYWRDMAHEALPELMRLPVPPTAIFCGNDEMAIGAITAAQEMGLRVPEDLSIVGFDDMPTVGSFDLLTSVRQPIEDLAQAAFCELLSQIDGSPASPGQVFPTALTVRRSTASPKEESFT